MKIDGIEYTAIDLSETSNTHRSLVPRIRITQKVISFNPKFCNCLKSAPFIEMYVNTDARKLLFKGSDKKTLNCRTFCQPRKKKKLSAAHGVNWSGKKIVEAMNKFFNNKSGVLSVEGECKDDCIVFDLKKG